MSAGVEGNGRLRARPPRPPSSRVLAAEAAAAVNVALSPEGTPPEVKPADPVAREAAPAKPAHPETAAMSSDPQPDPAGVDPEPGRTPNSPTDAEPHDHHLLIDAHEDRWAWRRKIRQSPRKLFFYRICVALLGLLLICLAAVTGPLPGPGGIPIALLGIAVWSSEFEWAQRLMYWFKVQLKRYLAWPRAHRLLFWALFAVICASLAYLFLVTFGVPFWVPEFAAQYLRRLPGV
jgi:uncharacterized protein (TIGR02611 family)